MKEVSMYMAKDGQVFVTEKACLEHEQKQTVSSVVKELTAEMGNLGLFHHPIKRNEGHPVIYVDDLETFLIDKAKYIHHRIGGALIQEKKSPLIIQFLRETTVPIEEQYNSFDDQLYERCCRKVAANMIANGWNKHARKFDEVKHRKARQLYNNIA